MKSKLKWILSAALMFSVTAPISAMDMNESAGMEEVRKRSGAKRKVRKPIKIMVKKPRKDFGPGLVENK